MMPWSTKTEEELTLLIKDWLKLHGRTQADLKESLQSESSRMPALLEQIKKVYFSGGFPKVASLLCKIEESWVNHQSLESVNESAPNSFGQLDLLLEELREDCDS